MLSDSDPTCVIDEITKHLNYDSECAFVQDVCSDITSI